MKYKQVYHLPSGRAFVLECDDGYMIECTEMMDVAAKGKAHEIVRNTLDPKIIWPHLVPHAQKWLLTVSTQKGCPHKCQFCDVPRLPFQGNLTKEEIVEQIRFLLEATTYVRSCAKAKIGFARMGEPAHNLDNVLWAMLGLNYISANDFAADFDWLPCFNSILPRKTMSGLSGFDVLDRVIEVKEDSLGGFMHVQLSCNSTSEPIRKALFGGADALTLPEIIEHLNKKSIRERTITLNFIVMAGVPIDVQFLRKLGLNKEKYVVKLIPLNRTIRGQEYGIEPYANYTNFEKLATLADQFAAEGIPVVCDTIAKCEEAGLCCGQLVQL